MRETPASVLATRILVLVNALGWAAFGFIVVADLHPALPDAPLFRGILVAASALATLVLAALFVLLGRRSRIAWYAALAIFLGTFVVTFFDDVGLADLLVLIANVLPASLLIKDRAWYGVRSLQRQGRV